MSFMVNGEKKYIIDKTVIELLSNNKNIEEEILTEFCLLLKSIGTDFIEVNSQAMNIMKSIKDVGSYIFRIDNMEDIKILEKYNFKYIVVDFYEFLNGSLKNTKSLQNLKIIFEITFKDMKEIYNNENFNEVKVKLKELKKKLDINAIRIKGVSSSILFNWEELIKQFKEDLNIKVDICPTDEFYMATAVAVEAAIGGADYVTTTFSGYGNKNGFAALEEVILSLKIIKGYILSGNTKLLPQLSEVYKRITKKDIYKTKAIIGEDIFKCESGIHVDGINKKASTYEPYNPIEIGQKRKIVIGKHSGSKAIINKLEELNINFSDLDLKEFLEKIKELSMQLRHEISDEEFLEITKKFGM